MADCSNRKDHRASFHPQHPWSLPSEQRSLALQLRTTNSEFHNNNPAIIIAMDLFAKRLRSSIPGGAVSSYYCSVQCGAATRRNQFGSRRA